MSSLQISKDCYFKKSTQENTQKTTQGTTQEPEESCNDILAVEKQRFEEEKEGMNIVLNWLIRKNPQIFIAIIRRNIFIV